MKLFGLKRIFPQNHFLFNQFTHRTICMCNTPFFKFERANPQNRIETCFFFKSSSPRWSSSSFNQSLIRNVGIIAHVDAGKTTISERMLYYSGKTKFMGEVHNGSTVMDFMELERERGITIGAAATSFHWSGHQFNLIDTPGHVDFSAEVDRTVMVLDGAVMVLDAVAGVQAQTESVWKQTVRRNVPVIAFINKLDRDGADMLRSVNMIQSRLSTIPFVLQLPLVSGSSAYGHVDLLNLRLVTFSGEKGETVESFDINDISLQSSYLKKVVDDNFIQLVNSSHQKLLEQLVELDEEFAEVFPLSSLFINIYILVFFFLSSLSL
jgi:elongation factor G